MPEQLRPVLHGKIDQMDAKHLSLLHRVLLQIEAEELAEQLGTAFDRDEANGKLDRLPAIVQRCRLRRRGE